MVVFFFFSSRRRHTRCGRDWSSDVCSSDLKKAMQNAVEPEEKEGEDEAGFKLNIVQAVGFKQRAFPLYEMLREAEKAGVERSEERRVGKECRASRAVER